MPQPQIDQIHDVMEREEGYAERQHDIEARHGTVQHQSEIGAQEVRVFENGQHGDVSDDRSRQDDLPFGPDIGLCRQPVPEN